MKKTKIFKRLSVLVLALTVVTCTSNITAFAADVDEVESAITQANLTEIDETRIDTDPRTIVMYDQDGEISEYKKIEEISNLDAYSNVNSEVNNDGLIVSSEPNTETDIADNNTISIFANSKMQKVSMFSISQQPYRNVCFIHAIFPDGYTEGSSGTLVGKNVVLASGHGIYDPDHGGMATTITVWPGFYHDSNGQHLPWGQAQSTSVWMASGYQNNLLPEYDWSLICLNNSFTYFQPFGYAPNYSDLINRTVRAIGYKKEQKSPEMWNMYTTTGKITGASDKEMQISISLTDGHSGGPLIDEATGAVIGVISHSETLGPIVTSEVGVRIDEWLYNIINQCVASNQ